MSHPDWDRRFRLCHRRNHKSADFWSPDFWFPDLQSEPIAPSSLFFKKNDTSRNEVHNLWRWAFSHHWSFQDMETLPKRLQIRSFYTHQPQQPPLVYKQEEFKLQTSPLSSRTLSLSLSNRLLSGQGKRSCRYIISLPSEKPSRRRRVTN